MTTIERENIWIVQLFVYLLRNSDLLKTVESAQLKS